MLKEVYKLLITAGRVAVVDCKPNKGKGKAKDKAAKKAQVEEIEWNNTAKYAFLYNYLPYEVYIITQYNK